MSEPSWGVAWGNSLVSQVSGLLDASLSRRRAEHHRDHHVVAEHHHDDAFARRASASRGSGPISAHRPGVLVLAHATEPGRSQRPDGGPLGEDDLDDQLGFDPHRVG